MLERGKMRSRDHLMRQPLLVLLAAAAMALFATAASARETTTAPSNYVNIYVNMTDKGASVAVFGAGEEDGVTNLDLQPLTRGNIATVLVHNLGKKSHSFTAFGKATKTLAPGSRAHYKVRLLKRGKFPWAVETRGAKPFRGAFTVE